VHELRKGPSSSFWIIGLSQVSVRLVGEEKLGTLNFEPEIHTVYNSILSAQLSKNTILQRVSLWIARKCLSERV